MRTAHLLHRPARPPAFETVIVPDLIQPSKIDLFAIAVANQPDFQVVYIYRGGEEETVVQIQGEEVTRGLETAGV